MNALRLIFGWVFLAGLTAAGTFYGMDEVDSRIGLASLHLHDKFGITRYAAAAKKVVTPPVTVITSPTGPTTADTDPHSAVTPAVTPPATTPDTHPGTPLIPPSSPAVTPITPVYPPAVVPAYRTPSAPAPAPRGAPSRVPDAAPGPRPKDFNEVNDRLTEVRGRAEGTLNSWASIQQQLSQQHLPLRPAISGALSSLRSYVAQAEQALRAGDTATARHDLDQAEKQIQILDQLHDQ